MAYISKNYTPFRKDIREHHDKIFPLQMSNYTLIITLGLLSRFNGRARMNHKY